MPDDAVSMPPSGAYVMADSAEVKLLKGSPFYDRQELHRSGYVASLNPDTLLYQFRKTAHLPQATGTSAGYSGWDANYLKGHIAGHYLSATSRLAAATGDTSLATKANYLVSELAKVQTALGGGYVAGFPAGAANITVPYYIHHKTLAGLVDAYHYLGNKQALDVAVNFANYLNKSLASVSYAALSDNLSAPNGTHFAELGGMTDVLTELYTLTNDPNMLKLAVKFEPSAFIAPLAANQDQLTGRHGNAHIAFIDGSARYGNVTGDAAQTAASANFWTIVTQHRSYVHGGNTVHEYFEPAGVEATQLPYSTGEECNSHNMLKLTARLIERGPQPGQGDYFERTLYNHILASIAPDTGRGTYYMPLRGLFRTYVDSTYCCMGTGIENTGRYNEGIYYKGRESLVVNLYIPSQITWAERGLVLQQQGFVPMTDTVTFTVVQAKQAVATTIHFRVPRWVSGPARLSINGQGEVNGTADTFLPVSRIWKNGDTVTLKLPLGLRVERASDQSSMVAIFYGPALLAGRLGSANMPNDQSANKEAFATTAPVAVPDIVSKSENPSDWLVLSDASTLSFKAQNVGAASGLTFQPFYAVHHERYSVYFQHRTP